MIPARLWLPLALASLLCRATPPLPIPAPKVFPATSETIAVEGGFQLLAPKALSETARLLAADLRSEWPGRRVVVEAPETKPRRGRYAIRLELHPAEVPEGYSLEIQKDQAILRASQPAGAFYGTRTVLTFVGDRKLVSLYADGRLVGRQAIQMVLPLVHLGHPRGRGFQGILHRVTLREGAVAP